MSETRTVRLGDVCQVTMGQAPKGDTYNTDGEGYPLIAGAGDFDKKGGISVSKFTTAPTRLSEPGDIIMSIRASIGATVWADKIYCLGRGVAGLRPGPELDSQFLWYWLPTVEKLLLSKARGATFVQVNRKDVEELPMELPPLDEQRKFAEEQHLKFLIQQKRERQQELFKELEKSVFIDIFGHPVSNSKNFPLVQLSELGDLERGVSKHRPRNAPELMGGPYPLIQTGDVAQSGGYITTYTSTYSQIGLNQSKIWPTGTLCITIAANIAKTGILRFNACFPDSIVGFTSTPETTLYVKFLLEFLQEIIEKSAPQSAQKNINLQTLRNLRVPKPNQFDLLKFYYIVGKIETA